MQQVLVRSLVVVRETLQYYLVVLLVLYTSHSLLLCTRTCLFLC